MKTLRKRAILKALGCKMKVNKDKLYISKIGDDNFEIIDKNSCFLRGVTFAIELLDFNHGTEQEKKAVIDKWIDDVLGK